MNDRVRAVAMRGRIGARLDRLTDELRTVADALRAAREREIAAGHPLDRLERRLELLAGRLERLEWEGDKLHGVLAGLDRRLTALEIEEASPLRPAAERHGHEASPVAQLPGDGRADGLRVAEVQPKPM